MPIELNKNGFIGSISYKGQNVNIFGEKFSDVFTIKKSTSDNELVNRGFSESDGMLSDRDGEVVSNRNMLANALEDTVQNDIERNKLAQYKQKIALIESEQAKLAEIREKANALRFTK